MIVTNIRVPDHWPERMDARARELNQPDRSFYLRELIAADLGITENIHSEKVLNLQKRQLANVEPKRCTHPAHTIENRGLGRRTCRACGESV